MTSDAYKEMAESEKTHWWFRGRRSMVKKLISKLNNPGPLGILEVGAGTGGNLQMLSKFGEVKAVECDGFARDWAANTSGMSVLDGRLPHALPDFNMRFDLICLFDVLEHVEEDLESLVSLAGLLAPNGNLILTVPAYPWLWSIHDERLHHKRRYTRKGLSDLASSSGLRVKKLTYFNTFLFPAALMMRLGSVLRLSCISCDSKTPPRLVNAALAALFRTESHLVPRMNFPFGLSLVAVLAPVDSPH